MENQQFSKRIMNAFFNVDMPQSTHCGQIYIFALKQLYLLETCQNVLRLPVNCAKLNVVELVNLHQ